MEGTEGRGLLIEAVTVQDEEQETYGMRSIAVSLRRLDPQEVRDRIAELFLTIQDAFGEVTSAGSWEATEIKVKIGMDVEGRFFVASGKASSAIEIKFKKP